MAAMNQSAAKLVAASAPDEPDTLALAALLKAASDPLRLQILRVLHNNAFGALELSEIFAMRQNAMSHHLKLLSQVGLIVSRREGTHIFYRRSPQQNPFRGLCDEIFSAASALPLPAEIQLRMDEIQEARAATSRAFFAHNADKFREQQDLIASFPQYGEAVLATLDQYALAHRTVLEVGPGQGDLLAGLSRRFARVWALDNAREMLEQARATARKQGLEGIEFVLGDTGTGDLGDLRFDVITLNMVLHHTPAPADIIDDLSARLGDDGLLLVTELCGHDQDWAREACGDLWLGFEPEDLATWAAQAGLREAGSEFLALKNGFSIQIRQFSRSTTPLEGSTRGVHNP